MSKISGTHNELLKTYRKLKQKKWRQEYNYVPLEGLRLIREAFNTGVDLAYILYTEEFYISGPEEQDLLNHLDQLGVECHLVSESLMSQIAFTDTPQGILGVANFQQGDLNQLASSQNDLLLLYQIQDPGNLGTLIRSADVFGFGGIVCYKGCVDPTNDKVVRSSMGSIFNLSVIMDVESPLSTLAEKYYNILAADTEGDNFISDIEMDDKQTALIVGNEAHGLSDWKSGQKAQSKDGYTPVKIPMVEDRDSLNAGIAGSIMMYELSKRKM